MGKWSQLYTLPSGSGDAKFNKFVGGPNGFATLGDALASAVPGDAILVRSSYTMTGDETITTNNIHIEFSPNATAISTSGYRIGIVGANNVSLLNATLEFTGGVSATYGIYLGTAENCKVYGCVIKSTIGGFVLTNAVYADNLAQNNMVDARVDIDTVTNLWTEFGTAANNMINVVHKQTFMQSSVGKLTQNGDTTSWNNYPVIDSPAISTIGAGAYVFDCSQQHIFQKTGGTGAFTLDNMSEGQTITIIVTSTGSAYTITWTPGSGEIIRWPSVGAVPTPTTTAGRFDLYNFIKIGGQIYGTAALNMDDQ